MGVGVDFLFRLQEGLLPLVTKLDARKVQLGKLEAEVSSGFGMGTFFLDFRWKSGLWSWREWSRKLKPPRKFSGLICKLVLHVYYIVYPSTQPTRGSDS